MSELFEALKSHDVAQVLAVLERDPSCANGRDNNYDTPLHVILDTNYYIGLLFPLNYILPVIQILLDYGADVNAQLGYWNDTPLHLAVCSNKIEVVKLLLKRGANPNLRNKNNDTPLHPYLVYEDHNEVINISIDIDIIKLLLQHGADINAINYDGCTPLDITIRCDDDPFCKSIQFLIDSGAKANKLLNTLVNLIPCEKTGILIKFLIINGAKIDLKGRFSTKTLYFAWSMHSNDLTFIENILIEQGIDVEVLKREGAEITELHTAAKTENENQVRALLEAGADVNAKDVIGQTPLHSLINRKTDDRDRLYRIVKLLIETGANFHAQDYMDRTAFHLAVLREYSKVVNLMLAKISGVEESTLTNEVNLLPELKNLPVINPLAVALILGYIDVVDNLIEKRYHIVAENYVNCAPLLNYAILGHHYGVTKMLLEAGCLIDRSYPSQINIFDLKSSDNKILELVCLLWEFNCIWILRKSLINAMQIIIQPLPTNKLVSLLIFYYKIGLLSNKLDADFISVTGVFQSSRRLTSFFNSQDDLINELKKDPVCDRLSKFDLLTMKLDLLVKFLNDEDNLKACKKIRSSFENKEEIEHYECAMKIRLDLAIEKRELLDSAKDCFIEALRNDVDFRKSKRLPDEIIYNILGYLSTRELKKMSVNV